MWHFISCTIWARLVRFIREEVLVYEGILLVLNHGHTALKFGVLLFLQVSWWRRWHVRWGLEGLVNHPACLAKNG